MGTVFLQNNKKIEIEEFSGSIDLHRLIKDIRLDYYTEGYTVGLIGVLAKIGHHASEALARLKELAAQKEKPLIQIAAQHAIKQIGGASHSEPKITTVNNYQKTEIKPYKKSKEKVNVTLTPINLDLMNGIKKLSMCEFCSKVFIPTDREKLENSMLTEGIFCSFCLRNSYYEKETSKNILIISFRALIGYLFYSFANSSKTSGMSVSDLKEMTENHFKAGVANHLFRYDSETFTWFINFAHVSENKMPVSHIINTIKMQLVAFGCAEVFFKGDVTKIVNFVENSVNKFYNKDTIDIPLIIMPTEGDVKTCKPGEPKSIPMDAIINFSLLHLNDYRQKKYV